MRMNLLLFTGKLSLYPPTPPKVLGSEEGNFQAIQPFPQGTAYDCTFLIFLLKCFRSLIYMLIERNR